MIDSIGFHSEITNLTAKLVKSYNRRDASACASCFTADATILLPGHPTTKGRSDIMTLIQSSMDSGHEIHRMRIQEADAGDRIGYAIVNLMSTRGEGQVLFAFRRDSGAWLIHSEAIVRD
jgi:ketosteroid isomerase-like protein